MRAAALLLPITLLLSSCSDRNDRTYAFNETVGCLREAGYRVVEVDRPTPNARDVAVWKGERLVYALVFLKSVALAKENFRPPVPEIPDSLSEHRTERHGNVIVIITHPSEEQPTTPSERKALDRCMPEG